MSSGATYVEHYRAAVNGNVRIRVFKAPSESMCNEEYHGDDPIDGLLMYTTGIYRYNLAVSGYDYRYLIPHIRINNATIYPNAITDVPIGGEISADNKDGTIFMKYSVAKPYEINNVHVYTNDFNNPNAVADWQSEFGTNNAIQRGCFLVTDANYNPILEEPHVWLTEIVVSTDNGKDTFVGANAIYRQYSHSVNQSPFYYTYYNKMEHTHYFYRIRYNSTPNAWRNLLQNWLYFTPRNMGMDVEYVFIP